MFEKLNNAEIEHSSLEKISNACLTNPPTSKIWTRGMMKIINNMKGLVTTEQNDIEQDFQEASMLTQFTKDLQDSYYNKLTTQNKTIERVAEQFLIKADLKERLLKANQNRALVITLALLPLKIEQYKKKIKEKENKKIQLKIGKVLIQNRLDELIHTFQYLQ